MAITEHSVELGVQPSLGFGVIGQQEPDPGQGVGRGLMSGHEERHGLVAELLVGHPAAALLVLSVQEHRQQIAPVLSAAAALGDDREDDLIEPPGRSLDDKIRWSGKPVGNGNQPAHPLHRSMHKGFHRRAGTGRVAANLGGEERSGNDLEGQPHHVGLDVACLPVFP